MSAAVQTGAEPDSETQRELSWFDYRIMGVAPELQAGDLSGATARAYVDMVRAAGERRKHFVTKAVKDASSRTGSDGRPISSAQVALYFSHLASQLSEIPSFAVEASDVVRHLGQHRQPNTQFAVVGEPLPFDQCFVAFDRAVEVDEAGYDLTGIEPATMLERAYTQQFSKAILGVVVDMSGGAPRWLLRVTFGELSDGHPEFDLVDAPLDLGSPMARYLKFSGIATRTFGTQQRSGRSGHSKSQTARKSKSTVYVVRSRSYSETPAPTQDQGRPDGDLVRQDDSPKSESRQMSPHDRRGTHVKYRIDPSRLRSLGFESEPATRYYWVGWRSDTTVNKSSNPGNRDDPGDAVDRSLQVRLAAARPDLPDAVQLNDIFAHHENGEMQILGKHPRHWETGTLANLAPTTRRPGIEGQTSSSAAVPEL